MLNQLIEDCPNCDSDNLEVLDERYEDDYHIESYQCDDCGCTFTWESKRTIDTMPEETPVAELKQVQEHQRQSLILAEEEAEEEEDSNE